MLLPLLLLSLRSDLTQILNDPALNGANVTAQVSTLDGKVLFTRNPGQRVMPASNQKLFSTSFACYTLGVDYRPKTRFWKSADSVTIDSPGDPLMTDTQLEQAAKALGAGTGSVKVRQAYRPGYPESWEWDDFPNRYAASVAAFSCNQGGFEMWAENGSPMLLPRAYGVKIDVQPGDQRAHVVYDPRTSRALVIGLVPQAKTKLDTLAIPKPDVAAASYFGSDFQSVETVPEQAPDLVITGKSMPDMLAACLKPSDNLIAENLLMMAATKDGRIQDPYPSAKAKLTKFLTDVVGIDSHDFHVTDGSGMSRHNMVTTREIVKLLIWAHRQPTSAVWHASLDSPSDGTLKNRLKGINFEGKTGTLDMVVALSGYVHTKHGKTLVMSVIANNFSCGSDTVRGIVDSFTRKLAETQ